MCVFVCAFITLHITAQPDPVKLIFKYYSMDPCVRFIELHITAQPDSVILSFSARLMDPPYGASVITNAMCIFVCVSVGWCMGACAGSLVRIRIFREFIWSWDDSEVVEGKEWNQRDRKGAGRGRFVAERMSSREARRKVEERKVEQRERAMGARSVEERQQSDAISPGRKTVALVGSTSSRAMSLEPPRCLFKKKSKGAG